MEESLNKQKIVSLEILLESNRLFLIQLKKKLLELSSFNEKENLVISNLIQSIEVRINFENDYSIMMVHFEEMNLKFYTKLTTETPSLTQKDLRILSLIKIGLSNKDIATIQNVTYDGIKKSIQRIRKKMKIEGSNSIRTYIMKL